MSGTKQLEQGHHQRASQTYDSEGDHPRTGRSFSVHQGRCIEGLPPDTPDT